jgi:hypothetical protein
MPTRTIKIKNIVFAIAAAPAAMPVKPNIPAIIATTKNINVHFNIKNVFGSFFLNKEPAKIIQIKNK